MASSAQTVLGYLHSFLSRQRGEQDDDRRLLQRFTEGRDGDAFALLMRRHGPMVLRLANRVLGDAQLAEDVFQAAFLTLTRKAHTIRQAESLSCWLHGVAFRLALRIRRSRQCRHERETHFRPASPTSPLDELTAQEFLAVLDEELQQLPEAQRAPLILCCLEGLSLEEAARRLGCSVGAIKGRLERGRQRLRLRLEKRDLTLPAVLGGTLLISGAARPVPAALMQTTLRAATTKISASPTVAALIEVAMRSMFLHKLKAIGTAVMLLVLTGTGASMLALRPQTAKENAPLAGHDDKQLSVKKRVDLYGDPLPKGAVRRLGTLRRRAVGMKLAVTANGKSIIGVRESLYLNIWDAATGRPLRVWRAHTPRQDSFSAKSLDISPDGHWILSAGSFEPIKMWDASSEKEARSIALPPIDRLRAGDLTCFHLRIRADGSQAIGLFGAMTNPPSRHKLATWDLKTGQMRMCHTFEQSDPRSSALSPDGGLLLHKGDLVDTASGRKIARLEGPPSWPCVFSRDGALVLGVLHRPGQDGLRVWESATGKTVAHLKPAIWTHQVAFHPDNRLLAATGGGIQLYDAVTGKMVANQRMPKGVNNMEICFAFAPDGRRLATGMPDGTILVWDVSLPPLKPQRLEARELDALWTDLADADAAKAWRAVWRLADAPQDALSFLRGRVKPSPIAPAELTRKLLADLDSDSFAVREAAVKRLNELGTQAEPALRAALKGKPSLEQRRRIEELIAALREAPPLSAGVELRQLRALIALERIATPEARRLLEQAAKGPDSARLTRQARAALASLP